MIAVRRGGAAGAPPLLLLHGLGASGRVWDGLIGAVGADWRWACPDLPGHGDSDPAPGYSIGGIAASVAQAVEPEEPIVVLGHSLGGAVGLALASGWFGVKVAAVCGIGIKVRWTPDELARAAELASRDHRQYPDRDGAAERALKLAGLTGLTSTEGELAGSLISRVDGGWTPRFDPAAFAVGAPDMAGLLAAARSAVVLAAGEHDRMCPREHLTALDPAAVTLSGLGHNAHVEGPEQLRPLVGNLAAGAG